MVDKKEKLLKNESCLCITDAQVRKSSWFCRILHMSQFQFWSCTSQCVFFLVHWILCKSSGPFLNFPKHCFIFKLRVHHNLRELFGFIVVYLLQNFIWSHNSHKLLLMFWSTSQKVAKRIKTNQTPCFWVTAEHPPETHKQE